MTSDLIGTYVLLRLVLDIPIIRTYWLLGNPAVASLLTAKECLGIVLLVVESWSKIAPGTSTTHSPDEDANVFSRRLLAWLISLFVKGYSQPLTIDDLYSLNKTLSAGAFGKPLASAWWKNGMPRWGKYGLAKLLAAVLHLAILGPVLPRLLQIVFTFCQPFLIRATTVFLDSEESSITVYYGYGLIGAYLLVYTGIAITNSWYWYSQTKFQTQLRAALITLLYQKSLRKDILSLSEAEANTLMSADVDKVVIGMRNFHELWAAPVELAIGLWLLYREVKLAMLALCFLSIAFSNMLLAPVLVFSTFLPLSQTYNMPYSTERIFSTLSLISLMTEPFINVLQSLPHFSMVFSCLGRIELYMLGPEYKDTRKIGNSTSPKSSIELTSQVVTNSDDRSHHLMITDGDFRWGRDLPPALTNINIQVPASQLTVIMGPVACGKTTLLHAILGEIACARGTVRVPSKVISYCSQKPWITNTTIKRTIIGHGTYDERWYEKVVLACALKKDFAALPRGDESETGSGGATLSGGQKQRVSLARALYQRSPLVILDDVFSGLDQATQDHISRSLFDIGGLLHKSQSDATTVLATHSVRFLKYAHHVINLSSDGTISSQGPPSTLKLDDVAHEELQQPGEETDSKTEKRNTATETQPNGINDDTARTGHEVSGSDKAALRTYIGTMGAANSIAFILMGVLYVGLYKIPDYWARRWGEHTDAYPRQPQTSFYLGVYSLFYGLALIVCAVWFSHLLLIIIPKTGIEVHSRLLRTLMNAKYSFLARTDVGSIVTRFGQDLMLVDTELPMALMNTYIESLTLVAQLVLIASASVYLLAAFPFLAAVIYTVQRMYLRTSKRLRHLELETKGPIFSHFDDTVRGLTSIRAFAWQDSVTQVNNQLLDTYQRPYYLLASAQVWLELVLNLLVAGLATITIGVAVATRSSGSGAQTAVALLNLVTMGEHLKSLIMFWTLLEICLAAITRVSDFVSSTPQERSEDADNSKSDKEKSGRLIPPGPANINMTGVSARYSDDGDDVLADVSLRIDPGMKVAICGRSGSGKSSLMNIMLKMMDVSKGELRVFNTPSTQLDPQRLRRMINTIPQEPYFFHGSVRENLDPESRTSDKEMRDALQHVGFGLKLLTDGYLDGLLEVDSYSAGELQLLSLVRAMLRPRDILILDEATSNVDEETHRKMHTIIAEHFSSSTVIEVMHRLDQLHKYDAMLVMDKGRVIRWSTSLNEATIEID
ncbi:uncharacterized protein JN550_007262 [Neoarthrinium moseri]|uniref:uncharacterized protein n=1 Tax=Neoarthrinium moseri TaxID=1658444 RepID=UPI001FDB6534|nr:uncharacterized protein JN550_007262 [Neoarthrinium moseri]KAI1867210.1 hypothetical protein JN550_007262 [Neoarthrinium moseri]